ISALGHALAAGLVIRYLTEQVDRIKPVGSFASFGRYAPGSIRKQSLRITEVPTVSSVGFPVEGRG
nr:hypothetical protein [Tanacetum cinerariifolium]